MKRGSESAERAPFTNSERTLVGLAAKCCFVKWEDEDHWKNWSKDLFWGKILGDWQYTLDQKNWGFKGQEIRSIFINFLHKFSAFDQRCTLCKIQKQRAKWIQEQETSEADIFRATLLNIADIFSFVEMKVGHSILIRWPSDVVLLRYPHPMENWWEEKEDKIW